MKIQEKSYSLTLISNIDIVKFKNMNLFLNMPERDLIKLNIIMGHFPILERVYHDAQKSGIFY